MEYSSIATHTRLSPTSSGTSATRHSSSPQSSRASRVRFSAWNEKEDRQSLRRACLLRIHGLLIPIPGSGVLLFFFAKAFLCFLCCF